MLVSHKTCLIVSLFLVFVFSLDAYSQKNFRPGYIVRNEMDTVSGLINFNSNSFNSEKCEFKRDINADIEVYSPDEIKSYLLTDYRHYVSKAIDINGVKRNIFLEYLVDGVVDLYYHNIGLEEFFFLEKDGEIIPIDNKQIEIVDESGKKHIRFSNQYRGAMKTLFSDAPEIDALILKSDFYLSSLIKITKEYHRIVCTDEVCIDYSKMIKREIFLEVVTGVDLSFMGLALSTNYSTDTKPAIGLNLRYFDNRYNSKMAFKTGFNVSKHTISGEYHLENNIARIKCYGIDLDYTILRIPAVLEYAFMTGKFQPTISFSFNNCFILYSNYYAEIRNYTSEDRFVPVPTENPLRKYQFGFELGFGFMYHINQNSYLTCSISGEYREPARKISYILDTINFKSMLFRFAYGFRIR
jgi:hypothetical protein